MIDVRKRSALALTAAFAVVIAGGTTLGRWLDPTRRFSWGGLTRVPPFAVPDFALRDDEGRDVRRADLVGRAWVADFVFLQCGQTCTVLSRRLRDLSRQIGGDGVRFVSFSVDASDGSDALARYRSRWTRDLRWRFLVADERFPPFAVGMGAATSVDDVPAAFVQSGRWLFLVDATGIVRQTYDGLDDDAVRRLGDDLRALVADSAARAERGAR